VKEKSSKSTTEEKGTRKRSKKETGKTAISR
jgi:hypothetical protein